MRACSVSSGRFVLFLMMETPDGKSSFFFLSSPPPCPCPLLLLLLRPSVLLMFLCGAADACCCLYSARVSVCFVFFSVVGVRGGFFVFVRSLLA